MGLGNGYPKQSNKGSNYGFELRSLQLLSSILLALGGTPIITTRTPSAVRETGAGAVGSGSQSVSIYNAGVAAGSVFGTTVLNPGERISFSAGDQADKLGEVPYDASGTDFLITTLT